MRKYNSGLLHLAIAPLLASLISITAAADAPPDHLLASCLANGCSATIVSRGERWACGVSAAHCYIGRIGGTLPVQFVDGSQATGILLAVDRSVDLARFAVPSEHILAAAAVAEGTPDRARYEMVGWPAHDMTHRTPYYFLLSPARRPVRTLDSNQYQGAPFSRSWEPGSALPPSFTRWAFAVDNGGAVPGVSGSGIYANGQLCAVLSNNNGHDRATIAFTSTLDQLRNFLAATDRAGCAEWNMGAWSAPVCHFAEAPPPLASSGQSNHPFFDCDQGRCRLRWGTPQGPVPPPPDAGHDPVPPREPAEHSGDEKIYDGCGRRPADLNSDRKMAAEIDRLRHELAELESRPPRQGPPGKDGRDGIDAPPPVTRRPNFIPVCLMLLIGFAGGIAIGWRKMG